LETTIKNAILTALKYKYPGAFIVKLSDKFYAGLPDILFIHNGLTLFMEVKTKVGHLSKIQQYQLGCLKRNDIPVAVVRSPEEALEFVERNMKGGK